MRRLGYKTFDLKNVISERKEYHEKLSVLYTSKNICDYEIDTYYFLLIDGKIRSWMLYRTYWILSLRNQEFVVNLERNNSINSVEFSTIRTRGPDKNVIYLILIIIMIISRFAHVIMRILSAY